MTIPADLLAVLASQDVGSRPKAEEATSPAARQYLALFLYCFHILNCQNDERYCIEADD
jgi:hypothetical protein